MQSLFTTLLLLAASSAPLVSANSYTLYCGSSCSDTSNAVSTGSDYSGASCTALANSEPYCWLSADEPQYKAIVSTGSGCQGGTAEQVIWPGECYEGPWDSFQVSVNL